MPLSQLDIDEKIQDLIKDVRRDLEGYLENYGLNAENFIDKDSFVKDVIDTDGYGMLSSYDGNYDMELRDFVINKFTQLDFLQGGNIYHVTRSLFIIRL